jgi:toluene monooxygenase system protein B
MMAQVPLASSFQGDFILKLVVVEEDDTMDQVAQKVAGHTADRTAPLPAGAVLRVRLPEATGPPLPRDATVRSLGLYPMDAIEIVFQTGETEE